MRRKITMALVGATAIVGAVSRLDAAEPAPATTRIDPNPTYGASVTIEEGVRVFRPIPPDQNYIVNPGGQTPIGLGAVPFVATRGSTPNGHR